jgi:hypothetical protein
MEKKLQKKGGGGNVGHDSMYLWSNYISHVFSVFFCQVFLLYE